MKSFSDVTVRCALAAAICLAAAVSPAPAGEPDRRPPMLEAAGAIRVSDWQTPIEPAAGFQFTGATDGWMRSFWNEHKYHLLTTFLMVETDYLYASRVGTSRTPLLFGEPTGVDSSVHDSLYEDNASSNFIENHKTNILRAVALGSILGSHKDSWGATGDDLMGLLEAEKFTTASTGLVKRIVGRRRPVLDRADATEIGQSEYDAIQASDSGHLSFYSAATSEAFTYGSYLDLVVARRLEGRRGWRIVTGMGFYGLAGYIGYTRLRQGEHYLTDVLAGAAAGTFVGRGFYKANHRDENGDDLPAKESRFHFSPPVPVPGGGMVSMTVELGR